MNRSKRSHDESVWDAEDNGAAHPEENSSDENDLQTPTKKVLLNLAKGESSVVEETKSFAFGQQRQYGKGHVVTPGFVAAAAAKQGDSPSLISQSETGGSSFREDGTAASSRRALFTAGDASKPQLVTPSRSHSEIPQSPAKRSLRFGRSTCEIMVKDSVKKVYGIIRKLTGSIGGNASHGPIYGELTMGSMQKMVELMKQHTGFDHSSRFIDVGSGIGKPNFHVANDPGVDLSYGLEVDADRWLLSMNCLRATLELNESSASKKSIATSIDGETGSSLPEQRCIFIHGDIKTAKVFDPFTHVYMFSIGFPPTLWLNLAKIWNRSSSPFLICFHGPRDIIRDYEFDAVLLAQTPTSMHGSKEGHTGYVYRRQSSQANMSCVEGVIDPVFTAGIELVRGGSHHVKEWVQFTLEKKMSPGPTTRARRRSLDRSVDDL